MTRACPVVEFSFNWGPDANSVPVSIGWHSLVEVGGGPPTDAVLDLIEVISAVHHADCTLRRPAATRAGVSWARRLRLRIGLRCPGRWNGPALRDGLGRFLAWLTDDEWEFEFGPRVGPNRSSEDVQIDFVGHQTGDAVALFSGGLDSLCGWIADVDRGAALVGLSVEANRRMAGRQRTLAADCAHRWTCRPARVRLPFHLQGHSAREASQRSRGFTFLGLASATASIVRVSSVRVYENGVGAMNLPYTAAQTGAHSTWATRPETLHMASELLGLALEQDLQVVNPNQLKTKGAMCASLPEPAHRLVPETESCDFAFARRVASGSSCGRCTSCLLRRQALTSAGLGDLDPPTRYQCDAFAHAGEVDLYPLRAMLGQAARIESALSAERERRWDRLVREYPDLVPIAFRISQDSGKSSEAAIIEMYRSYVEEWRRVPCPLVTEYLLGGPAAGGREN